MSGSAKLNEVISRGRGILLFKRSLEAYLKDAPDSTYPAISKSKRGLKRFFASVPKEPSDEPVVFTPEWASFLKRCEQYIIHQSIHALNDIDRWAGDSALDSTEAGAPDPIVCCVAAVLDNLTRFAERQASRENYTNAFLSDVKVIHHFFEDQFQPGALAVRKGQAFFAMKQSRHVARSHVDIDTMYFEKPEKRHSIGEPADFLENSERFRGPK